MNRSVRTADSRLPNSPACGWSVGARVAASVLLAWHVVAIAIGPLAAPAPGPVPRSPLFGAVQNVFQPYVEATYLDHGYKFFAPDPGYFSQIVRFDVTRADGTHERGTLPDRNVHWPRLRYHRHFMLSEFLGAATPAEDDAPVYVPEKLPTGSRLYFRSYADHLKHAYQGTHVQLELVRHVIPSPEMVRNGRRLDDPASYEVRGQYTRD